MTRSLDDAIRQYFGLQEAIFAAFGYVEDWCVLPMDDCRDEHWMLLGGDPDTGDGSRCVHSDEPFTLETIEKGERIYIDDVYQQRFLKRWVYRTPSHVLVCVDTHTDGNRLLRIFEAGKECTDPALKEACDDRW